jgi:3-hydroxyacyl-[acyl-carrier-protein] dehydratase
MTELDSAAIQALIPHRPPFLMIDRVVEIEAGKRIVGVKEVDIDRDWFLKGHFPGYPVMPGVLIVEALAQAGAVLVMQDPDNRGRMPLFARVDNCRFRQQVRPGDSLRLEVEVTSYRDPVGKAHGRALVGDKLACEADLTFALALQQQPA